MKHNKWAHCPFELGVRRNSYSVTLIDLIWDMFSDVPSIQPKKSFSSFF
jgi:hypothetical protein